ncbi:hypothetical protein [Gryllotalpicola ginsengisoli]|uniref:hypothetical protein n=1 Tax=Gryllotalpicola ginsengisoli TaxID=444608 RepID=UPI0003B639E5|nr:hypothetical protein [Gryllotalpicola ginsengisoli]
MRYRAPEGTYIAWLDARDLGIDGSPAEFFRERAGVALTDGAACGEAGRGFLRFILATPRPILEQAVRQMAEALDDLRTGAAAEAGDAEAEVATEAAAAAADSPAATPLP